MSSLQTFWTDQRRQGKELRTEYTGQRTKQRTEDIGQRTELWAKERGKNTKETHPPPTSLTTLSIKGAFFFIPVASTWDSKFGIF